MLEWLSLYKVIKQCKQEHLFEGDNRVSDFGCLIIHQTKDWTSHSKVVIRTDNQDLLNSLLHKTTEMSANGFGKMIYNFGCYDKELHIFSQLGHGTDVLSHLLDGQDFNRLSREATIDTIN